MHSATEDSPSETHSLGNLLVRRNGAGKPFPQAPSRSNGEVLQIRIRKESLNGRPLCGLEIETHDNEHPFLAATPGDHKIQILRRRAGTGHPTGIRSGVIYARDVDKAIAWAQRWFVVPPSHGPNLFCWRMYDDLRSHLRHEKLLRFTKGAIAGIVTGSVLYGTGLSVGRKVIGKGFKAVGNHLRLGAMGLTSCLRGTLGCLERTEERVRRVREQREERDAARARAASGGFAHGLRREGEVPAGRAGTVAELEMRTLNEARGRMAKARGDVGVGSSSQAPSRTTQELHELYLRDQAAKHTATTQGDSSYGSAKSGSSDSV